MVSKDGESVTLLDKPFEMVEELLEKVGMKGGVDGSWSTEWSI